MAHIKDPEQVPGPPGIEDRRMAIYRELFFNNMEGFLSNGFPVLKSLYGQEHWLSLVRAFFARHQCQTPLFLEIGREFLHYLANEHEPRPVDPPFLVELAHYEWLELMVATVDEPDDGLLDQLDDGTPLAVPACAKAVSYPWPVHEISRDFQPNEPLDSPIYLLVYRDRQDEAAFMAINAATAQLLLLLEQQPGQSPAQLVEAMAALMPQVPREQLARGLMQTLAALAERGAVRRHLGEN
ncbi:putative DNA-binding domain-containing protein [Gallaecimonas sp. GXIMD4217]|uniref:HvfC family RiPP maturation protein n=1 Tax=Gallaecimonas sp. GXIMD4217 TaxID=3131927 RepID=UPI00311ACDFA